MDIVGDYLYLVFFFNISDIVLYICIFSTISVAFYNYCNVGFIKGIDKKFIVSPCSLSNQQPKKKKKRKLPDSYYLKISFSYHFNTNF